MNELVHDEKATASLTLGDVVRQTAHNFPDSRFHPEIIEQTSHYTIAGINPNPYNFWLTADGIGTKPDFSERLYSQSVEAGIPEPEVFEGRAFDTMAMIESDEARFGRYMVGAANVIDMNNAKDVRVVNALARGLKRAADEGRFAILNGELAELSYRASGYGDTHVNWNAVGVSIFNPEKLLLGKGLQPNQPIIALREKSIRSNGLTKARAILEADYLLRQGLKSKNEYVLRELTRQGVVLGDNDLEGILTSIFGHDALEQVLPPWHKDNPEVARQFLEPSRLYGPAMYAAQGKIDEPRNVEMVAAAHISGGGVPEKAKRMLEGTGLGVSIDAVFPDPEAVDSLLKMAEAFPGDVRKKLNIDDKIACEQWNRGIGFLVVVPNLSEANHFVDLVGNIGYEAAIAGKTIDRQIIQFRGHEWAA